MLVYSLGGKTNDAYNIFIKIIKDFKEEIDVFSLVERDSRFLPIEKMYRLRKTETVKLTRNGIFHVPLSERKKVDSCRFSIPGLPVLYLGTSAYVCWEELSRPSFDLLYIARFSFYKQARLNLFNMSVTNKLLLNSLKENPEDELDESIKSKSFIKALYNYLLWPLFAICQIRVQDQSSPFKPEYIVPQILMQYIGNEKNYDGIIYPSTRVYATKINPRKCLNIVLPVKELKDNMKFCEFLKRKTILTEPLSIKFYEKIIHKSLAESGPNDFELIEGLGTHYITSHFGFIEYAVENIKQDFIVE